MDQILDRLYIGDIHDAKAADESTGITCLFNVSQYMYAHRLPVIRQPIMDEFFYFKEQWQSLINKMAIAMRTKHTVLAHCRLGKSRSVSLAAAYLAYCGHSKNPEVALAYIQGRREIASPHSETWRGVCAWWSGKTATKTVVDDYGTRELESIISK